MGIIAVERTGLPRLPTGTFCLELFGRAVCLSNTWVVAGVSKHDVTVMNDLLQQHGVCLMVDVWQADVWQAAVHAKDHAAPSTLLR